MPLENQNRPISSETENEMSKYGIIRVPVDYFHLGEFRYTNLKDAIAHAKQSDRSMKRSRRGFTLD